MKSTEEIRAHLKTLLVEGWEHPWPEGVPRQVPSRLIDRQRLLTIVGPRRAGKTYLGYQLMHRLLRSGVPKRSILVVNWEDERLSPPTGRELTELLPTYDELQDWDGRRPLYLFLDEIQNVPQWSKWTRRVMEQHPSLHLVLTGSSSKLLSTELATELRGRGSSFTLYPYSFDEWLSAAGPVPAVTQELRHSREAARLLRSFDSYLARGGFPEVRREEDPRPILQGYYRAMFLRDLVERYRVQNVGLLEDFLKIQISRFAALSSLSSIHKELIEVHGRVSKSTLSQYARAAREILLLFEAMRYSPKVREHLLFPKKVYAVDHGLLEAIRFSATEDQGRLLENAVFMELKRRGYDPFYFKERQECDFVLRDGTQSIAAVQACWALTSARVREREVGGLEEALDRLRLKEGWIITRSEFDEFRRGVLRIHVRPFWHFALDRRAIPPSTGALL
jgi:predicted AAA+ superfamily ATPase